MPAMAIDITKIRCVLEPVATVTIQIVPKEVLDSPHAKDYRPLKLPNAYDEDYGSVWKITKG